MAGPRLISIKNTFIEVHEAAPAFELARQLSDPSPQRSLQADFFALESLSDPDEDLAGRDPGSQESTGGSCSASASVKQDEQDAQEFQEKEVKVVKVECSPSPPPSQQQAPAERKGKGAQKGQGKGSEERQRTQAPPQWEGATTVMMRNLPNKYKQQMLLDEIAYHGFHPTKDLDFFYLPMDHNAKANLGYCFINFVDPAPAWAFAQCFEGKKMRYFHSNKVVVVMPASMQGFERNYAYYATSRVAQAEDPQYRPLFFRQPNERADGQALQTPRAAGGNGNGARGRDGKGRQSAQQAGGRERQNKRNKGVSNGDNASLAALHEAGNKVLNGTWQGADSNGYSADTSGAANGANTARGCNLCGAPVVGSERLCGQCGYGGQGMPQSGSWADMMPYCQQGQMMVPVQDLDYSCWHEAAWNYSEQGSDYNGGLQVAPR